LLAKESGLVTHHSLEIQYQSIMSKPIQLTEWLNEDHGSMRCIAGTDPNVIANRVAFIEKTPRVRVRPFTNASDDHNNWSPGPKGSAPEYGRYQPSRDWCDAQLVEMGYELSAPVSPQAAPRSKGP
jgi:hypothetical protein